MVIKFFYEQFGDASNELAKQIHRISDELQLLNQLITHGKQFENMDISDLKNQINILNDTIRNSEYSIDSYEINQRIAQFNLHTLEVMKMLESMRHLPSLDNEEQALEESINDLDQFIDKSSEDPSRKEVMAALDTSRKLLAQVSKDIETTRDNPLVAIAECYFEGAQVAQRLDNANKPKLI